MADKKISALTGATTPLAGTEVLPIVQGGSTVKVSVADLTAGRTVTAAVLGVGTASPLTTFNVEGGTFLLRGGPMDIGPTSGATGAARISSSLTNGVEGKLIFSTSNSSAAITEAMNIDKDGNVTNTIGNLVIGTAGKGIDFSANTHAAGMTSELLNDYEEGTWTPEITASVSNPTPVYTVQSGSYTKKGREVTATFIIQYSAIVGGVGDVRFSLPFTGGASAAKGGPIYLFGVNAPIGCYSVCLEEVTNGTAYVGLIFSVDSAAFATATVADLPVGVGSFRGQITYFV
jgi:hypothetical protein